jgi:hypothetical protein
MIEYRAALSGYGCFASVLSKQENKNNAQKRQYFL